MNSSFAQSGPAAASSSSTAPANLSSLLLHANSLTKGSNGDSELPQIRYGLDEIERLSDNLGHKAKRGRALIEG